MEAHRLRQWSLARAGAVRLYKAQDDPAANGWKHERELLSGEHYDPTIFEDDGIWYMFTRTDPSLSTTVLHFSKESLRARRPTDAVRRQGYRLAQDCIERHGAAVKAFEIIKLNTRDCQENTAPFRLEVMPDGIRTGCIASRCIGSIRASTCSQRRLHQAIRNTRTKVKYAEAGNRYVTANLAVI